MFLRRLILLLGLLFPALPLLAAKPELYPGLHKKWQHYQSPHFDLYSANGDEASRDVLGQMELLHAVFLETFRLRVRMPQRVTIFHFNSTEDFNGYIPQSYQSYRGYGGFWFSHPDQMVLTMAPAAKQKWQREISYAQYVPFLFRIADQNPPVWYRLGMAELFSVMRDRPDAVELGHGIGRNLEALRAGDVMDLRRVLSVELNDLALNFPPERKRVNAQSWALLHYVMHGANEMSPTARVEFLKLVSRCRYREAPEFFTSEMERLLGMDWDKINPALVAYAKQGKVNVRTWPRPGIPAPSTYSVRPVPTDEMTIVLAELDMRVRQGGYGTLQTRELATAAPSARRSELLGTVALIENNPQAAREHWQKALDLGGRNPGVLNHLWQIEFPGAYGRFEVYYRLSPAKSERMRSLLLMSIEAAPEQSTAYEMLAWTEAVAQESDPRNVALVEQRLNEVNDPAGVRLALAMVRIHRREKTEALRLLAQAEEAKHNLWIRQSVEIGRAFLEERPVNPEIVPPSLEGLPDPRKMPILRPAQ